MATRFAPGQLVTLAEDPGAGLWTVLRVLADQVVMLQNIVNPESILYLLQQELSPADVPPPYLIPPHAHVYDSTDPTHTIYEFLHRENGFAVVRDIATGDDHRVEFMSIVLVPDELSENDRPLKRSRSFPP